MAERHGVKRVLIVSTDPASNLDEVLGAPLAMTPLEIPSVPGLLAMNLDPEQPTMRREPARVQHRTENVRP